MYHPDLTPQASQAHSVWLSLCGQELATAGEEKEIPVVFWYLNDSRRRRKLSPLPLLPDVDRDTTLKLRPYGAIQICLL